MWRSGCVLYVDRNMRYKVIDQMTMMTEGLIECLEIISGQHWWCILRSHQTNQG